MKLSKLFFNVALFGAIISLIFVVTQHKQQKLGFTSNIDTIVSNPIDDSVRFAHSWIGYIVQQQYDSLACKYYVRRELNDIPFDVKIEFIQVIKEKYPEIINVEFDNSRCPSAITLGWYTSKEELVDVQ